MTGVQTCALPIYHDPQINDDNRSVFSAFRLWVHLAPELTERVNNVEAQSSVPFGFGCISHATPAGVTSSGGTGLQCLSALGASRTGSWLAGQLQNFLVFSAFRLWVHLALPGVYLIEIQGASQPQVRGGLEAGNRMYYKSHFCFKFPI